MSPASLKHFSLLGFQDTTLYRFISSLTGHSLKSLGGSLSSQYLNSECCGAQFLDLLSRVSLTISSSFMTFKYMCACMLTVFKYRQTLYLSPELYIQLLDIHTLKSNRHFKLDVCNITFLTYPST